MIPNIISPSNRTPELGKMYVSKLLSGAKRSSAKVLLVVVITVIDKSGCDTFCTITGEPLVFGIVEIKADVVVIKVDVTDIAVGIAVNASADVVIDVLVGSVVDTGVDVIVDLLEALS